MAALYAAQQSEVMVDVTICCENRKLRAHKLVLAMGSPFFRSVFDECATPHPVVALRSVNYEELELLIKFLYVGEVYVQHKRVRSLVNAALFLQLNEFSSLLPFIKPDGSLDENLPGMVNTVNLGLAEINIPPTVVQPSGRSETGKSFRVVIEKKPIDKMEQPQQPTAINCSESDEDTDDDQDESVADQTMAMPVLNQPRELTTLRRGTTYVLPPNTTIIINDKGSRNVRNNEPSANLTVTSSDGTGSVSRTTQPIVPSLLQQAIVSMVPRTVQNVFVSLFTVPVDPHRCQLASTTVNTLTGSQDQRMINDDCSMFSDGHPSPGPTVMSVQEVDDYFHDDNCLSFDMQGEETRAGAYP
uniref:BTB domain-containing protein n=1 Tax=Anopheles epiroticus TaxID=199890 RepID=A0A182PEI4_9DIPT